MTTAFVSRPMRHENILRSAMNFARHCFLASVDMSEPVSFLRFQDAGRVCTLKDISGVRSGTKMLFSLVESHTEESRSVVG